MKLLKVVPSDDLFPSLLEMVEQGEIMSFVVSGMSMWPLLRHGKDLVFIGKCQQDKIKKGDIILFQTPEGRYLLHRIMKKKDGRILTAGDSKCRYDGEFPLSCVKAKVVMVKRGKITIHCNRFYWRAIFWIWRMLFPVRSHILYMTGLITRKEEKDIA